MAKLRCAGIASLDGYVEDYDYAAILQTAEKVVRSVNPC